MNPAKIISFILIIISFTALSACVTPSVPIQQKPHQITPKKTVLSKRESKNYEEIGVASWYGKQFHRKRTSSGERFNMYKLTAAHKTLPLSTYVMVTNLVNGRQVVVKVNDRGPFISGRLIDLSYAAAKKLGMVGMGTAPVNIKAVG